MTLHLVLPPASDTKFYGEEPTWHDVAITDASYNREMLRGFNWHNYCASEKDFFKYVEQWLRVYHPKTFRQDIILFRDKGHIVPTFCILARMQLQGFVLTEKHISVINEYIAQALAKPVKTTTKKTAAPTVARPTIQDRIRQQVAGILSDLDVRIDDAFDGNLALADDIKGDILSHGFKGPQLKIIQDYLNHNIIEWSNAYSGQDEQLVQGYEYVGRRNLKKIMETFREVLEATSEQSTRIKAQHIRKRKPTDKKKMASKLRYMKEYGDIKSKNPVDIISANVVWIYDTKKRRLGYYEAEVKDSLFVQGTKIQGFKMTCEKILRKSEEQLPEILALRKNQTINWFNTIKAKCKPLTGRMTADCIILRID